MTQTEGAPRTPHTIDVEPTNMVERMIVNIAKVLSLGYVLSIAVTIYDIAMDKLASPTVWVYDVVTTAIAVSFVIGGSWALQRHEHIRITALFDRYPERRRRMFDAIGYAGALVYLFVVMWFSWRLASEAVITWEVGGSAWAQPTPVVVKVSMFLGTLLMLVQGGMNLRKVLLGAGPTPWWATASPTGSPVAWVPT